MLKGTPFFFLSQSLSVVNRLPITLKTEGMMGRSRQGNSIVEPGGADRGGIIMGDMFRAWEERRIAIVSAAAGE